MGLGAMGGKGVAGEVLRTGLQGDENLARGFMVGGAGMDEKGALGRPVSPSPEAIPIKVLVTGPDCAEASLGTLPCEWTKRAGSVFPCCRRRAEQRKSQ